MGEEIKDVNKKIDDLEAGVKKYASKDTVISIGGYEFTPAKLMVAFTIISSILGGLYGVFEVYKTYQSMQAKIAAYEAPDLTEINKKIEVLTTKSDQSFEYTKEINTGLKADIRRIEKIVEQVERDAKASQRETDRDVREIRKEIDQKIKQALDNPLAGK